MDHLARTSLRLVGLSTLTGVIYSVLFAYHAPLWLLLPAAVPWVVSMTAAGRFGHLKLFPPSPIPPFQDKPHNWLWAINGIVFLAFGISWIPINWYALSLGTYSLGICIYFLTNQFQETIPFFKKPLSLLLLWGIISLLTAWIYNAAFIEAAFVVITGDEISKLSAGINGILYGTAFFVMILQLISRNDFLPSKISPSKNLMLIDSLEICYSTGLKRPGHAMIGDEIHMSPNLQHRIWQLAAYQMGAEKGMQIYPKANPAPYEKLLNAINDYQEIHNLKVFENASDFYCLQCMYPAMNWDFHGHPFPYCPICKKNEWLMPNVQFPIGQAVRQEALNDKTNDWWIPVWNFSTNRPRLAWVDSLVLAPNDKVNIDWLAFWWLSQLLAGNPRLKKGMEWVVTDGVNLSAPTLAKVDIAVSRGLINIQPTHLVQVPAFKPISESDFPIL